jgi:hypothetical protein
MTATNVRFEEREGAQDLSLDPQINRYGNFFACQGAGGTGNGIRYFAVNAASLLANGPFVQLLNLPSLSSFVALRQAGIAQVTASAAGLISKTLTVDDPDSDNLYALGDTVTINYPSEGFSEQPATVIGIEEAEGESQRTVHFDDLPLSHPDTQRGAIKAMHDVVAAGGARSTMTVRTGLAGIDLSGQQAIVIKNGAGVVVRRDGLQLDGKWGTRTWDNSGTLLTDYTS